MHIKCVCVCVGAAGGGAEPARGETGGADARWQRLLMYVLCYVCLKGYVGVQADVRNIIFTPVSQFIRKRIQLAVLNHLHALSHNYHIARKTGAVLHVVERGSSSLQTVLSLVAFHVLPALLDMTLCGGVFMYSGHRALAGITAATMVIYLSITAVITDWRTKFRKETLALEARSKQRAIESITHYEAVKLFGGAPKEARQYGAAIDEWHAAEGRAEVSLLMLNAAQQVVMGAGLLASMTMAARQVVLGKMSVGDLVLVNTYLLQLYQPLNWIGSIYRMIQQNFVEMEQLFALLEEPVDVKDAPNATDLDAASPSLAASPPDAQARSHFVPPSAEAAAVNASALSAGPQGQTQTLQEGTGERRGQWSIEFDNVSFSYDARREVLRNFSLTMRPGETVAIVGPSGSGKSTVARLLCRLYDPTAGRVSIAGRDLRFVTLASVRRVVGVVPQDAALFQNTIQYNIAYAKPGDVIVPRTEVEEAAQGAQMHQSILAFPDGYQSQVGERGLRLSGGERQRLSLARVLLKKAHIVVLDEATSALDSGTEAQVQVALQRACAGRTSLVIAHRLSTISHADRILVLVNGSVAETGTHRELLVRNGHYADMWKLQQHSSPAPPAPTSRKPARRRSRGSVLRVRGGCAAVSGGVEWRRAGPELGGHVARVHNPAGDEQARQRQNGWWRGLLECLSVSPQLFSCLVEKAAGAVHAGQEPRTAGLSRATARAPRLDVLLQGARFLKASEVGLVMQIYGDREIESGTTTEAGHTSSLPSWPGGEGGSMASATSFHPPKFPSRLTREQAQARLETPDGAFLLLNFSALLLKNSSAAPPVSCVSNSADTSCECRAQSSRLELPWLTVAVDALSVSPAPDPPSR